MQHASIDLTINTYTDLRLLDVAGAVEALPGFPLDGCEKKECTRATGSDGPATSLAPTLAPTSDFSCISPSIPDNSPTPAHSGARRNSGGKWAKNTTNLESRLERAKGFEPSTSSLGSWHSTTELRPLMPKMLPASGGGVNPFRRAANRGYV